MSTWGGKKLQLQGLGGAIRALRNRGIILVSGHEVLARRPASKVQVTLSLEHEQLMFPATTVVFSGTDGVIGPLHKPRE